MGAPLCRLWDMSDIAPNTLGPTFNSPLSRDQRLSSFRNHGLGCDVCALRGDRVPAILEGPQRRFVLLRCFRCRHGMLQSVLFGRGGASSTSRRVRPGVGPRVRCAAGPQRRRNAAFSGTRHGRCHRQLRRSSVARASGRSQDPYSRPHPQSHPIGLKRNSGIPGVTLGGFVRTAGDISHATLLVRSVSRG